MSTIELDPVEIRKSLVMSRHAGTMWPAAWAVATGLHRVSDDDRSMYKFMHDHFRAAYHNDHSPKGRCRVDERDVSAAIKAISGRDPERDEQIVGMVREGQTLRAVGAVFGLSAEGVRQIVKRNEHVPVRTRRDRCRSGDGCDRLATRGRFGPVWCEHHGRELERASERLQLALDRANPRNGGNDSLYSHQAA